MGYTCRASGQTSVALGYRCSSTDDYFVALGYRASSGGYSGCIVLGDESNTDSVLNTANNQFAARYAGGYRLYTNSAKTLGVSLAASGTAWATISDSTKKEKFLKADADLFLKKLSSLKLGSWNYKGLPGKDDRHYGPMAQEIFAAYGQDKYGKIGCDTLLTTLDMDGIMMILLQGLEKRTSDQVAINKKLSADLALVRTENELLKDKLAKVEVMQKEIFARQQTMEKLKQAGAIAQTSSSAESVVK